MTQICGFALMAMGDRDRCGLPWLYRILASMRPALGVTSRRGGVNLGMADALRARLSAIVSGATMLLPDFDAFEFSAPEPLPDQLLYRINKL